MIYHRSLTHLLIVEFSVFTARRASSRFESSKHTPVVFFYNPAGDAGYGNDAVKCKHSAFFISQQERDELEDTRGCGSPHHDRDVFFYLPSSKICSGELLTEQRMTVGAATGLQVG